MYKIFFLFPLLFFILFIGLEIGNNVIVSGEIFNGYTSKLVEKSLIKSPVTNTSFNKELTGLYNEERIVNNKTQLQQPVVMVNTNIFSCIIENVNSEKLCRTLYDCQEETCKKIDLRSNLVVYGKEPIYSIITSNSGINSKEIKLQPGEYEILLKNNDFISSSFCHELVIDGLSFHEFTVGIHLSQDSRSILCMNVSDGCYGIIKSGETRICEINKVLIKNIF
jgi:hypothetical protein